MHRLSDPRREINFVVPLYFHCIVKSCMLHIIKPIMLASTDPFIAERHNPMEFGKVMSSPGCRGDVRGSPFLDVARVIILFSSHNPSLPRAERHALSLADHVQQATDSHCASPNALFSQTSTAVRSALQPMCFSLQHQCFFRGLQDRCRLSKPA